MSSLLLEKSGGSWSEILLFLIAGSAIGENELAGGTVRDRAKFGGRVDGGVFLTKYSLNGLL